MTVSPNPSPKAASVSATDSIGVSGVQRDIATQPGDRERQPDQRHQPGATGRAPRTRTPSAPTAVAPGERAEGQPLLVRPAVEDAVDEDGRRR